MRLFSCAVAVPLLAMLVGGCNTVSPGERWPNTSGGIGGPGTIPIGAGVGATSGDLLEIEDEAQRGTCADGAYAAYKCCREGCAQSGISDCRERCKKQCDTIHDRCHADCTKNDPTSSCHAKCNNGYGACRKRCGQDCKGN